MTNKHVDDLTLLKNGYDNIREKHPTLFSILRVFLIVLSLGTVHYAGFFDNFLSVPFFIDVMLNFYNYFIYKTTIYSIILYYSSITLLYLFISIFEFCFFFIFVLKKCKDKLINFSSYIFDIYFYMILLFGISVNLFYNYTSIKNNEYNNIYLYLLLPFISTIIFKIYIFNKKWSYRYDILKKYKTKRSFYLKTIYPILLLLAYLSGVFHMDYLSEPSKTIEFSNSYFHSKEINILLSHGDDVLALEQLERKEDDKIKQYKRYIYFKKDSFYVYNQENTPNGIFEEISIKK